MKRLKRAWFKNRTNISVTKDTRSRLKKYSNNKESFDGTINRLLSGRTEKERKYNPILKQLSEDKDLIQKIHDNSLKLRHLCPAITDNTCYTTAIYVCLRKSGQEISMREVEELMGVCCGTITRYYQRLIKD